MTQRPQSSSALDALSQLVQRSIKEPSSAALRKGHREFLVRVEGKHSLLRRVRPWPVVVASATFLAVGLLWLTVFRDPSAAVLPPVVVSKIEGGKLIEGGYLAAFDDSGVKLWFNEGSEFALLPGARGRLRHASSEGAHFAVERGAAAFRITPATGRHWSVEAGPFVVKVTGTEFSVDWDPAAEQFELQLERGKVLVSGPIVGQDLALSPGQRLSVSLRKAETVISGLQAEQAVPDATTTATLDAPATAPSASASEVVTSAENRAQTERATTPSTSANRAWRQAMANGEWDQILADADRAGLSATVSSVSSDELFMLTDAARYRRRPDVARAALLAHRERFPSAAGSVRALFLLGRVEELAASPGKAIEWYDRYLAKVPSGTYSAEALGRKMILWKDLHGPTATRSLAERYLRHFPAGTYAGTARALLGVQE